MKWTAFPVIGVIVAVIVAWSSLFIVDEREKALVLQFGQIKQVVEEPGLGFKVPVIQEVVYYDDRILSLDTETIEVTPADDRRLVVDAFARYRIADVVQFRQAVGIGGVRAAEDRLSSILNADIREVLGADQVTSDRILSQDRRDLARRILAEARSEAESLGLQIVDVRLKQTNLPQQNLDATFARMRAEREREAADEIARGNEAAQRVRAAADRTVVETTSSATREADIIRGEADAERNRVYAEAFGDNPEFFSFYRSLSALERSLQRDNSTLVISPDSEFVGPLFEAIRAEGLSAVEISDTDVERLRELAPQSEISPDLPDSAREEIERSAEEAERQIEERANQQREQGTPEDAQTDESAEDTAAPEEDATSDDDAGSGDDAQSAPETPDEPVVGN
ncbi:HflC protein [Roseivivax marinus]|jgi:membrane protease subunit HflC|uniref:HflC protein n=1 Tax=Roseivivax marinus TaxID=1379903 RepID=W4HMR9_9RHOB|nr:protease modulator HflC [Roseivivax marinus]ETW14004.1 HflC protein [Roseivivax marinus]SEK92518.1 protease FtsH subunit HflC [Roseivivax marinus]